MKEKTKNKSIIAIVTLLIIIVLTGAFLLIPKTYSADVGTNEIAPNITAQDTPGVTVYVNGIDVEKPDATKEEWYASAGSPITVSIINETKILKIAPDGAAKEDYPVTLTCTAGTKTKTEYYNSSWFTYNLPNDTTDPINIKISVVTREPTAADKGKYFGNPYLISNGESVTSLSLIFDGTAKAEDYARFDVTETTWKETLQHAYFRLTTNILISNPLFTGIGNSINPFQGCFDFGGYTASLKIVKTEIPSTEFRPFDGGSGGATGAADGETTGETNNPSPNNPNKQMVAYGFFAYIYGDGVNPCLIRNAKVSGSIAVNIYDAGKTNETPENLIMVGGVAGVIGKSVQLDELYSEVSVSVLADNESLYVGGVFGFCSSGISSWCNAKYGGSYSSISGITHGGASAFVGGFAGFMQNAYIKNFIVDANQCTIIANSLGGNTGVAIAGGFIGAVYMMETTLSMISPLRDLVIDDISINVNNNVEIVAVTDSTPKLGEAGKPVNDVVDPDNMEGHSFAISSGFIGTIYCITTEHYTFHLGDISFVNNAARTEGSDTINISAQTNDLDCYGAVFAGGLIGYVRVNASNVLTVDFNKVLAENNNEYTLFNCSADISAIQNGIGPAYAGGFFGYRAFKFQDFATTLADGTNTLTKLKLCASTYRVDILARQSPTSSIGENEVPYECLAGYFTSKLPEGYNFKNCEFVVPSGSVSAERNVGSTAVGEIAAGGFAGIVSGINSRECFNKTVLDGTLSNIKMNFSHNVEIKACCYSYKSRSERKDSVYFNNVYAGGFVGLAADYKSIDNITVDFNGAPTDAASYVTYSVHGVQNGVARNDTDDFKGDLKTEGFVGGMFGLLLDTTCSNSILNGERALKSRVYFESTASPNTASVGGIAGASWSLHQGDITHLNNVIVQNIRVIGKAYSERQGFPGDPFDLYVGGAVGVAGTASLTNIYYDGIVVNDCIVEAIGENQMLTYAGGVFGGIWWGGNQKAKNCVVQRSLIQASSVSSHAYAAGITGILQKADLENCLVLASVVSTEAPDGIAASAGIFAFDKGSELGSINSCSSSARISADGRYTEQKDDPFDNTDLHWNVGDVLGIAGIGSKRTLENKNGDKYWSNDYYFVSDRAQTYKTAYNYNDTPTPGNLHLDEDGGKRSNTLALDNDATHIVYPRLAYNSPSVKLGISDTSLATLAKHATENQYELTANSEGKTGVAYVYAYMKIATPVYENGKVTNPGASDPAQKTQYNICSYPVTVGEVARSNFQGLTYKKDNGDDFVIIDGKNSPADEVEPGTETAENSSALKFKGYTNATTMPDKVYDYFVLNVGQQNTVFNRINITPNTPNGENTFLTGFKLYRVDPEVFLTRDEATNEIISNALDGLTYQQRLAAILGKPASTITLGDLNGRISVVYDFSNGDNNDGKLTKMSMKAYQILRKHEIIIAEYTENSKTYGVVVEFRPNQVTGMTVTPSSSTPPLDTITTDGETQYVFAPGDTVRFDVVFDREYKTYGHYAVKVRFSGGTYVKPNGTINIPSDGYAEKYTVQCQAIDYNLSKTITILVRPKVGFEFSLGGAEVDSDRELLKSTYFQFTTTPHPGYGMRPDFSIVAMYEDGGTNTLFTNPEIVWSQPDADGKGTITIKKEGVLKDHIINYTKGSREQENEYTYQFYLQADTVDAILDSMLNGQRIKTVQFVIDYIEVHYMAFISDYGENSNYFFMVPVNHEVGKSDDLVSYTQLDNWSKTLNNNRHGYDMRGFYLTRNADSRSGYGTSFKEMVDKGGEFVSGAFRFYARWTYNISVAAPRDVTVKSGFTDDMLNESGSIVPIDDKKGFSFVIETPDQWEGTPRFSVHVVKKEKSADGTVTDKLVDITNSFKSSAIKNGYEIDADTLSNHCKDYGYIYLNVYADSLDFSVGDVKVYDTHNMYSDGVFTLEYSLNRIYKTDENLGDVTFNFNQPLPVKTSARLYYRKNGVTVWSGGCVLGSSKNSLTFGDFATMSGSGAIDRKGTTNEELLSEKFILVVTLPNNRENFNFGDLNSLNATISVAGYNFTPKIAHDDKSEAMMFDHQSEVFNVPNNQEDVTLYKPLLRKVTLSGTEVTFDIVGPSADAPADLVDYRHQSSEYVWAVEKTDDRVVSLNTFTPPSGWTETASTVLGKYYIADKGTFDISSMSLPNGYKLTLIEVINVRQPSEGLRLFEIKKNASGNLELTEPLYISATPEIEITETPTNPTT